MITIRISDIISVIAILSLKIGVCIALLIPKGYRYGVSCTLSNILKIPLLCNRYDGELVHATRKRM